VLRKEEADDIAHRDRCENAQNANKNEAADLASSIKKTEASLKRMGNTKKELLAEIKTLEDEIADTKKSQEDLLDFRNKDSADFKQALKDDHDAANLLRKAIEALSSFYKRNKMDVPQLVQKEAKPEYAQDADKAPEASFSGDYGGRKSESGGIIAILEMLVEDTEKEMKEGRADDSDAQEKYLKQNDALQATLDSQEATKVNTETELADLEEKITNYEKFFEDTKQACQTKATQWSVRTRLRTEELNGMQVAIRILSSDSAKKTFNASTSTFVQLSTISKHGESSTARASAYDKLKGLAAKFRSRSVAKIAVEVKTGGHFDKVILMIDDMIALLRKEEQDDIAHRDRCENAENANANDLADMKHDIKKTEASLKRMGNTKKELEGEIDALENEIAATKKDQKELLDFRNKEEADFRQALKDDTDAAGLLRKAIAALQEFYKRNKIDMPALVQKAPEYAKDDDKAPEMSWSGSDYGGRKSESGGIIAILEMLVEDTEKEMREGRADDADAQDKYLKQNGALQDTLDSQEETKASTETELGDLEEKISNYDKFKNERNADKDAEEDTKKSLGTDCKWVKTHFESRRDKRKTEIQGLVDAKGFLAGVAAGNDPLPLN